MITKEKLSNFALIAREIERIGSSIKSIESLSGYMLNANRKLLDKQCKRLNEHLIKIQEEYDEVFNFLLNIKDAKIREIFFLRYYHKKKTWQSIALEIGFYDESYPRKIHDAYIKRCIKEGEVDESMGMS